MAVPLEVDAVVAPAVAVELVLEATVELGVEEDVLELGELELVGVDVGDELVELLLWFELWELDDVFEPPSGSMYC